MALRFFFHLEIVITQRDHYLYYDMGDGGTQPTCTGTRTRIVLSRRVVPQHALTEQYQGIQCNTLVQLATLQRVWTSLALPSCRSCGCAQTEACLTASTNTELAV
jgi:hypothetical protein